MNVSINGGASNLVSTEDLILAAFLREEKFAYKYVSVVDESMFDDFNHKVCINAYLHYIRQYNTLPSHEEMNSEVHDYCKKYRIDEAVESTCLSLVSKCINLEYNLSFINDNFIRFATRNKITSAILEAAKLLHDKGEQIKEQDYNHIQDLITEALSIKSRESEGIMFSEVADDPVTFIRKNNRYDPETVIKTGIRSFDNRHIAGGPIPGEMYVVSAPPGRGKSTLLVNIGASAILQGKDVIHIFVGDNSEADGVLRYSARMTGVPMSQIMMNSAEYLPRWSSLKERFHLGNLLIQQYPIGGPTVLDIRSFITRSIVQRSIQPKVLILDYVDNCRRNRNLSSYDDLGDMYAQLKAIAEEMGLIVWTASQPKQETWDSDTPAGLNSLAESSKKQHHIDAMITMSKVSENAYKLYVPKLRRGASEFTVDLTVEHDRSLIRESIPMRTDVSTPVGNQPKPVDVNNLVAPPSPFGGTA